MRKKISFVVLALCLIHGLANSAVYQWVDEKGGVHFSDQPPPPAPRGPSPSASSQSSADKFADRSFPVPQHGNLVLSLPESWRQDIRQPSEAAPPTIVLAPRHGDDFKVMITPLWSPKNEPGFNSPQVMKRLVSSDLAGMLPSAVEREVPLQEIQGRYGTGYHFFVTDKAPRPGEYPYAMRAGIGVGDLMLSVTVLCRTRDSEGLQQTLRALRGAVQTKG